MRVLCDATAIPENLGGVGRYVDDLLPALAQRVDLYVAVQPRYEQRAREQLGRSARIHVTSPRLVSRPVRMLWEQTELPWLAQSAQADVIFSPHYTYPLRTSPLRRTVSQRRASSAVGTDALQHADVNGVPSAASAGSSRGPVRVVTIHDATFFSHPQAHSRLKGVFFRRQIAQAVAHADHLIVPSQATRDETISYVGGHPKQFTVAYHGVDRSRFHAVPATECERVAATLDLGGRPYIAFLGTLEPRKNVPALIRAWVRMCEQLMGEGTPREECPALVVAGARGWDEAVDAAIQAVPDGLHLSVPGYLPLEDLPGFLAGAQTVAYPSIGEGFGLPVLEAMACGSAVLTTNVLSLPEVGGDAVLYCEPTEDSITQGLVRLHTDPQLRADLAARAVERAAGFTWERAADQHVQAFEAALAARA